MWSDIPNDEQLRWIEEDGHVSRRFRSPAGNSNGNTFDYQGRQIACEHGTRRVVRYEYNGKITVLADSFDGKPLNAPNDAVVHPNDGAIWFTDPGYGGLMDYEGNRAAERELGAAVPEGGDLPHRRRAARSRRSPTSRSSPTACASARLHQALRRRHRRLALSDDAKNIIWVFDVDGPRLKNPRTFASMEMGGKSGFADGIRADEDGNIWSSAGWVGDGYDGVHIFAPGRRPHRPDPPAGDLLQRLLRRQQAQPPVHDRQPVALRRVRGDARRAHHVSNGFRGRAAERRCCRDQHRAGVCRLRRVILCRRAGSSAG